jgi:hypothetical protein
MRCRVMNGCVASLNVKEWEADWVLDMTWNSTLDRHAWLYSDHEWSKASSTNKPADNCLTRRRAWKRTMRIKKEKTR